MKNLEVQTGGHAVGEFLTAPQRALQQLREVQSVVKEVMQVGEHYGVIPGTQKPTLLQPGAQLLNTMYGYALSSLDIIDKEEEWEVPIEGTTFPLFRYIVKATFSDIHGRIVAIGIGECNSYEQKYRYRASTRKCPKCNNASIYQSKKDDDKGYYCWKKKGGCGAKFPLGDISIESQAEGNSPNEYIYDQVNTILKMAKKRAYVNGTVESTRTSGIFTQDVEDMAGFGDVVAKPPATDQQPPAPKEGVTDGVDHPTPEEMKGLMYTQITFGIFSGKKLKDLTDKDLTGLIAFLKKSNTDPGLLAKAEEYQRTSGMTF